MCAQVAPSGECLRGKGPPDRMLAEPWHRLFLAAYIPSGVPGIYLVVAAVLRDSLCRVTAALQTVVCCIPCVRLSGLS